MARVKKNYLFVDGYNIINSWSELNYLTKFSLEDARDALIDDMAEFASLTGEKVVIVFDAYRSDSTREVYEDVSKVKIVYTKAYQTADSFIEKEVDRLARRENVRVCTGDNQIQQLALERGATRLTASELKAELFSKRKSIKRAKKKDFQANRKSFSLSKDFLDKLEEIGKGIK
ncbi:MAG: NYN domain-containing protein [Tissierellia bacterium]|nr:NYN domain-containing protein [Tissierellia bacterium]